MLDSLSRSSASMSCGSNRGSEFRSQTGVGERPPPQANTVSVSGKISKATPMILGPRLLALYLWAGRTRDVVLVYVHRRRAFVITEITGSCLSKSFPMGGIRYLPSLENSPKPAELPQSWLTRHITNSTTMNTPDYAVSEWLATRSARPTW